MYYRINDKLQSVSEINEQIGNTLQNIESSKIPNISRFTLAYSPLLNFLYGCY